MFVIHVINLKKSASNPNKFKTHETKNPTNKPLQGRPDFHGSTGFRYSPHHPWNSLSPLLPQNPTTMACIQSSDVLFCYILQSTQHISSSCRPTSNAVTHSDMNGNINAAKISFLVSVRLLAPSGLGFWKRMLI